MAKRSKDVQVNLEPVIYEQIKELAAKKKIHLSSYIRSLIIRDLRDCGLLTEGILADLAMAG